MHRHSRKETESISTTKTSHEQRKNTDKVMEEWYAIEGSIILPCSSWGLRISKAARMEAIVIHIVDRAMWIPGQTLRIDVATEGTRARRLQGASKRNEWVMGEQDG